MKKVLEDTMRFLRKQNKAKKDELEFILVTLVSDMEVIHFIQDAMQSCAQIKRTQCVSAFVGCLNHLRRQGRQPVWMEKAEWVENPELGENLVYVTLRRGGMRVFIYGKLDNFRAVDESQLKRRQEEKAKKAPQTLDEVLAYAGEGFSIVKM